MPIPDTPAHIWLISLSSAIFRITPGTTLLSICLALTAQATKLLSFLLPLKIVMLLGAKKLPAFMPDIVHRIGFEPFILLLCGLTLVFFLIQLFSNKIVENLTRGNVGYILVNNNKLVLFEDQETIAKAAYKRITEASSSILFSLFGLAVLAYLYWDLAIVFLLAIALAITSMSWLNHYNNSIHEQSDNTFPQSIQTLGNIAFLALFAYIVIDYLYLTPPNFFIAIGSIIVSRQVIAQIQLATLHIHSLIKQKDKLSVIFLEKHSHNSQPQLSTHSLWHFLSNEQSKEQLVNQFANELKLSPANLNMSWIDLRVDGCGVFLLTADNGSRYLAKLFDLNKRSHALHEASLLLACTEELPAPKLIKATFINRYHCHIFDLVGITLENSYNKNEAIKAISKTLLSIPPDSDLSKKYVRSRKTLQNRLTISLLNTLKIAADTPSELELLANIESKLGLINDILDSLPLRISIPKLQTLPIGFHPDGTPVVLHWPNWVLDPLGAGWLITQKDLNVLILNKDELENGSTVEKYKISALASYLESCILRRDLKLGLSVASDLCKSLTLMT